MVSINGQSPLAMATEEVDYIDEEIGELLGDIDDKLRRAAKLKDHSAKHEVGALDAAR